MRTRVMQPIAALSVRQEGKKNIAAEQGGTLREYSTILRAPVHDAMRSRPALAAVLLGWLVAIGLPVTEVRAQDKPSAEATRFDQLSRLPFPQGLPSAVAARQLSEELRFERAVQTYHWAMPAMSLYAMREAQEKKFGAGANIMAVWKDRIDARTVVLTPNPDVIYAFAWLDLKRDGPTVVEAPPKLQGLMDDLWHRPITDVGLAGPDKGAGGKYLLLPPDYKGNPPPGYHAFRSPTYGVFVFWRAFLEKGRTGPGVALIEKTRIYPLAQKDNPPAMKFPNASGVPLNMLYPADATFYENLAKFIDAEPADPADFPMRGMAAGIGIVKGQPFKPDARTKALLERAAETASKMARALAYRTPKDAPDTRIYPDRMWQRMFASDNPLFNGPTYLDWDARIHFFQDAYATSPAMVVAMPGAGSQYLGGLTDADGDYLDGGKAYHVHVPAGVPVENYWSYVLYDAQTRSLLDNGQPFPSIASNTNLKLNADGSADLYFGPEAPKNGNANWIKTVPGRGYVGGLRLYSPTKAFFEKTWKPGNIEKVR